MSFDAESLYELLPAIYRIRDANRSTVKGAAQSVDRRDRRTGGRD